MTANARALREDGWTLRSGRARGADSAYEAGALHDKEIFLAKHATLAAIEFASHFHPNWDACSEYARMLHGRNAMIILGRDLKTPVEFVQCWTPGGLPVGETATAISIAREYGIDVDNLAAPELQTRML